jgi:hypothetical protein
VPQMISPRAMKPPMVKILRKKERIYNPNKGIAPGKCRIPEFFDLRT